jgi:hypothetical protein
MSRGKDHEKRALRLIERAGAYAYDAFIVLREGGMTKDNALKWIAARLRARINAFMRTL